MKSILILSLVLLLTGCGEKFDASSENMIKISYNNILKELEGNEKNDFQRQFSLYTQVYELVLCMDDYCTEKNDIESLHGLSYGQVIDAVALHEEKIVSLRRQHVKSRLLSLHSAWKRTAEGIIQRDQDFVVFVGKGSLYGYPAVKFSFTNKSGTDLAGFWLCLNVKESETGKEVISDCNEAKPIHAGGIISHGKNYEDVMAHREITSYLNKPGYGVTAYLANLKTPQDEDLYPTMTNGEHDEYEALMNSHFDIFKEVEDEVGEAPWYN